VEGESRRQASAADLLAAIDWVEAENKRAGSPLNGKIDTSQIAVMGQSCGGFLSVSLGADPRVDTIGVFNAGVQPPNPNAPALPFPTTDAVAKLHGPVLLIKGITSREIRKQAKQFLFACRHMSQSTAFQDIYTGREQSLMCLYNTFFILGISYGDAIQAEKNNSFCRQVFGRICVEVNVVFDEPRRFVGRR
jgi:acetyl esterase/lipase